MSEKTEPPQNQELQETTPSTEIVESTNDSVALAPVETPKTSNTSMRLYIVIAVTYLMFTVSDGAVRMLVLFYAYTKGFTPLEIGIMFVLYEMCGIATNLLAGIIGSRIGLKIVLVFGLLLQALSLISLLLMLLIMQYWFNRYFLVTYIALVQALSGIAKDTVKLSGKSLTKLSTGESQHSYLFKLVAFLTGAKNGMKGVGYFSGTLMLNLIGFMYSLIVLLVFILAALPAVLWFMDRNLGKSKSKLSLKQVFLKGWNVNFLSAARFFLFGSRDLWFEVPLPLFLRIVLGWPYFAVGIFMAVWIIMYGFVQSFTPQLVLKPLKCCYPPSSRILIPWQIALTVITFLLALVVDLTLRFTPKEYLWWATVVVIVVGLIIFAVFFAINSSIHSFLILVYTDHDKVAMNVGFYYMSNAGGRMLGTLISGILFNYFGIAVCIWVSGACLVLASILTCFLKNTPAPSSQGDDVAE